MAKSKKNNSNIVNDIIKNTNPVIKTFEWNGITISVKNRLNIKEVSEFVSFVSEASFTDSESYAPEAFEFAVSLATIEKYTDFEMPESLEDKYSLIMFTDIVDKITEYIDATEQYANMIDASKEKIDYKIEVNIDLVKKQVNDLFNTMHVVLERLNGAFKEIESLDVQNMIKKLESGELSENEIMEAYAESMSK